MNRERVLVVLAVFQTGLLVATLAGRGPAVASAGAALPNPAEQRNRQIEVLEKIDQRLERVQLLLESGDLQVRPVSPDTK